MINQTLPTNINAIKHASYGARLKSAREALGIDRKEIAAQLRLPELTIIMIESGEFKTDLPLTFIRGYIRNYSRLMEIPEKELNDALELFNPKPADSESEHSALPATAQVTVAGPASTIRRRGIPVSISNLFMRLFNYLLAITLIGLVAIWWHTHKTTPPTSNILTDIQQTPASPPAKISPDANIHTPAIIQTSQTSAPPAPTVVTAAKPPTTTSMQTSNVINKAKQAAAIPLPTNHYAQWLTSFTLFLIIISISMRVYAAHPHTAAMAGARLKKTPRKLDSIFDRMQSLTRTLPINKPISLLVLLVIGISLLGWGAAWWYQSSHSAPIISAPLQATESPATTT